MKDKHKSKSIRLLRKQEEGDINEEPLMIGIGRAEPPIPKKKRNTNKTTKEERQALRNHIDELDKQIKRKSQPKRIVKINNFSVGQIVELEPFDPSRTKGKILYIACRLALPSIKECDRKTCAHQHKNYIWVGWQDKIISYHFSKLRLMTTDELTPKIGRELSGKIGPWTYDAIKKTWKRDGDNREYSNEEFNDIMYFEQHPYEKEDAADFMRLLKKEGLFH